MTATATREGRRLHRRDPSYTRPSSLEGDLINIKLPLPLLEQVDRLSARQHITRAAAVRALIQKGLQDHGV